MADGELLPAEVAAGDQVRARLRADLLKLLEAQRAHRAAGCHRPECASVLFDLLRDVRHDPDLLLVLLFEAVKMLAAADLDRAAAPAQIVDPDPGEPALERAIDVLVDHYDRWPDTAVTCPHTGAAYALWAAGLLAPDEPGPGAS